MHFDEEVDGEERNFSLSAIDKRDIIKILGSTGKFNLHLKDDWKSSIAFKLIKTLIELIRKTGFKMNATNNNF